MEDSPAPLVLIVEDDPVIAKLLELLCVQVGFSTLTAADGERALLLLEQARPQLITLDLNLPQISGQEVLSHVRGCAAHAATPVIVVSAMEPEDEVLALATVAVKKPFEVEQLMGLLHQHAGASHALQAQTVGC